MILISNFEYVFVMIEFQIFVIFVILIISRFNMTRDNQKKEDFLARYNVLNLLSC